MSEHDEYIKRLDKIERDLSWIVQYLLKKDECVNPPPFNPTPPIYPIADSKCPKCSINLAQSMSYYCSRSDCPTGLGGTSC
jgi:hypothetical protein